MASNPSLGTPTSSSGTAPGPPLSDRHSTTATEAEHPSNPFEVDLVIPFSIALGKGDRLAEQRDIKDGYEVLLRALEGEGGLRIASRRGRSGKGKEEVWVFVGASEDKLGELVERAK